MRRELPMILAFLAGLIIIMAFFIPALTQVSATVQNWFLVVVAFAILVGGFNLLRMNYMKIRLRRPDWFYSVILIIGMVFMMLIGIFFGIGQGTTFDWLFNFVLMPMSATLFALLAFFVASAAYRAFRARNSDATLLLVAAFIVMIGQVPIGTFWVPKWWPFFLAPDWMKDKIMEIGNTAGQRAIMIGASLGAVSMALRVLLGIERSYLGEE